jgi:hypothetical protein
MLNVIFVLTSIKNLDRFQEVLKVLFGETPIKKKSNFV